MNKLLGINREDAIKIFVKACGITPASEKQYEAVKHELNGVDDKTLIEKRKKHLGPTYRHFYNNPLHLVKGIEFFSHFIINILLIFKVMIITLTTIIIATFSNEYNLFSYSFVLGEGIWVWDNDGNKCLDFYNNVPHVGHCHPHVVKALCYQAQLLNTHTRYLHKNIIALGKLFIRFPFFQFFLWLD